MRRGRELSLDLDAASEPVDVVVILRNASRVFYDAASEPQNQGAPEWEATAIYLQTCAAQIARFCALETTL